MSVSRFTFSVKPQEAILILITMFWGGTFLAVQYAVTLSDPFFFVGLRFATAAIAVGLISLKTLRADPAGAQGRGGDWRGDCHGV